MDYNYLADLLFPNVTLTPSEYEAKLPARNLPEGAKVTRFAPSPTGFVHFGGLFPVTVAERLAHQSGGVFYLRIEDTDAKREVEGATEALIKVLAHYGINFDEGAVLDENGNVCDKGDFGPYKQSLRRDIYHIYAKQLVKEGKAYPVFTTKEELEAMNAVDKKAELKEKDWHIEAELQNEEKMRMRQFTIESVEENLKAGNPFVLRMLSNGDPDKTFRITDLVKGNLELPENDKDEVLLKSDGIPTYHFAHAVDDHLMGTTHVIRGEEWLPSLPRHVMLFNFLGFKLPKYMHISQLMKMGENGSKKKLSKRDMGANMDDYKRMGYAPECVMEYVMTLLNSNYEEWHTANIDKSYLDFPFSIKKMSASGCLFDFGKLNDVSKNVISRMSADRVYNEASEWAMEFDPEFAAAFTKDAEFTKKILAIGRGGKKPRKDITVWSGVKDYMGFFYDEFYTVQDEIPEQFENDDVKTALSLFVDSYNPSDDQDTWFTKIKEIAEKCGFAGETKQYKVDPDSYKGHVGDISMFLRIAVTGKMNSPDMYAVMQILGEDKVKERINNFAGRI